MHLSGLFLYPVKSLRGCSVARGEIDALGVVGDRRFMIVDESGKFLTQRSLARMALIKTALTRDSLLLSAHETPTIGIERIGNSTTPTRIVEIWGNKDLSADDCGDEPAKWLSHFLGTACRLVRIGTSFKRPLPKAPFHSTETTSLVDAYPLLLVGDGSLGELNARLQGQGGLPVPMNRFRPNLVISDCSAFEEDTWTRFRLGEITFRTAGPCARCIVTTTDQMSGVRGKEPLRTLSTFRRDINDDTLINFGQNLVHETKQGTLCLGDRLDVLDASPTP